MARVSDLYRERFRSIKTVLFFIVSVSLLSGEAVPTTVTKINSYGRNSYTVPLTPTIPLQFLEQIK